VALVDLVQQAQRLFNQTLGNQEGSDSSTRTQRRHAAQNSDASGQDEFQPSSGNSAHDAGLFQVKQQAVFSATATVVLAQNGGAQNAAPPAPAASPVNTTTTDDPEIFTELQSLNTSLIALGLTQEEISVVDRVAELIKNFSPAAYASLVNQLQVLAKESGQSSATNAETNGPSTAVATNSLATTAENSTAGNTQAGGGFTLEAFSIKFAGVDEVLRQNGNGNNAKDGKVLFSAYTLRVSEAKLTFNNQVTGQSAQIQVPQAVAPATTTSLATAATA